MKIEAIHEDGYATVRRVAGEWKHQIAVCAISRLAIDRGVSKVAKPKSGKAM